MQKGTFKLIRYDEGGIRGSPERLRLVCNTESGHLIAIWGSESSTRNIDLVRDAGLPCTIECEFRPPNPVHAEKLGHTHWVPENTQLRVIG